MDIFKLDIGDIAELGTQVAVNGAIRMIDSTDQLFEFIVGIVLLIYEMAPD